MGQHVNDVCTVIALAIGVTALCAVWHKHRNGAVRLTDQHGHKHTLSAYVTEEGEVTYAFDA